MGDNLVNRLRDTPNWKREEYGDYKSASTHYDRAPFEAADRIEELEAKLAKAVGAAVLQTLHAAASEANYVCGCKDAIYAINPAHLAELKGEK